MKRSKLFAFGFAITLMGSVAANLYAVEQEGTTQDCSVNSTKTCATIDLGPKILVVKGEAKATTPVTPTPIIAD